MLPTNNTGEPLSYKVYNHIVYIFCMSVDVTPKLRALCDVLKNFSEFMVLLSKTSQKHQMSIGEVGNFRSLNISPQDLTKSVPPEKLGFVIGAMTDMQALTEMNNFMNCTSEELDELGDGLDTVMHKLEHGLE